MVLVPIYQIRGGVRSMVIKSVNETLYGVKSDISGSKNVKRVVVESGITLNAM